jgi:hypothetical protein
MKKNILKITILNLFAAAIIAVPATGRAQDAMSTNTPAAALDQADQGSVQTTNAPVKKHKRHDRLVFNGKLSAIDTNAMTLTVGKRTFEISSETRITKDGQPATLSDGVAGEKVSGAYTQDADGKLTATSIHFGEKKKKKEANPDSTVGSTNSVPN